MLEPFLSPCWNIAPYMVSVFWSCHKKSTEAHQSLRTKANLLMKIKYMYMASLFCFVIVHWNSNILFIYTFRYLLMNKFMMWSIVYTANVYLFKINNKNTRERCEISSKLKIKKTRTTSLTSFWCFYRYLWKFFTPFLMFLLLTLNK